ncbi:protein-glutamine gamma-glutamyltransferase E-like isoform X2 [Ascaphus truei]|uniref:protein-glutamine gamma-glutamyltransferase E-like isoform X2 n=1 Tax=Ascaphus truei TaxID=8439 RepID=UPI003F59ED0F
MAALKLKTYSMEETANMEEHSTNYYYSSDLILRRGQTFAVTLTFNRPVQKADKIEFIAETGPSPQDYDNTLVVFELSSSGDGASWTAVADSSSSNDLNVVITSPADAVIGRYKLGVEISSKKKDAYYKLQEFILLFNPWATDDVVFMEDEDERQEYVLNDSGILYYGIVESINEDGWNYGQFEEGILDICLILLDMSLNHQEDPALDCSQRNDPIYVGRVVSAMINSSDDEGVLEGKWSGKLWGGVEPTNWRGSVEILKKWHRGGYKPVKYGQCWVFAGVMCTVLRCLGIPTRTITNFASAHDKDANLTVDSIYDSSGKSMSKDTMWNFHVWNEGWFVRKDLGSSYNGWQILDATPQEKSHGIFRLGPTSQKAVKEGDVNLDYDGRFVFAEVNADTVEWVQYDDATKRRLYSESKSIGQYTSTKAVGSSSRVDVTIDYKYPEGTAKERAIFKKAKQSLQLKFAKISLRVGDGEGGGADMFSAACEESRPPAAKPNFTGKFKQIGESQVGQDVTVALTIKNTASVSKRVGVNLTATAIIYTGARVKEILVQKHYIILAANKEKNIPITIPYAQYESAITDDNLIKIVTVCEDEDDKVGKMLVEFMITLKNPPLLLKFHGQPVLNKPVVISITFCNPIAENVTNSILTLEGSGLCKEQLQIKVPLLKPNQTSKTEVTITPYRTGVRCLIADLSSDKFSNVKASQEVTVAPA